MRALALSNASIGENTPAMPASDGGSVVRSAPVPEIFGAWTLPGLLVTDGGWGSSGPTGCPFCSFVPPNSGSGPVRLTPVGEMTGGSGGGGGAVGAAAGGAAGVAGLDPTEAILSLLGSAVPG